jgi:hypothetical protein
VDPPKKVVLPRFSCKSADLDVDTLDDDTVDDLVVALGTHATRLEAAWCRLVGVWDRRQLWAANGSKSPGARLARETHLSPADPTRLVRRARHLAEMPHTAAAHAAGEVCGAHVDLVASCQRPRRNADFAASENLLVELCRTRWFDNAVAAIEHWKLLADRDATRRGANPATEGRHLCVIDEHRCEAHRIIAEAEAVGLTRRELESLARLSRRCHDCERQSK